ncbi:MAG: ABC transporter permease subunit [Alphaproteobacteria bacterium]|nr:ABC transporter permease subunit [Alphaproteobacteria bacterium]
MHKTPDSFCRTAVLYFIFIWLGVMVFAPNLLVLLASFLTKDAEWYLRLPLNLQNYVALTDTALLEIIVKSFSLSIATTVFCLLVGYPFTCIIARISKDYRILFLMLIIVPFWTNSLVRNYALISILSKDGFINTILLKIGLIKSPLVLLNTNFAVFVGMCYTLLPFMILPLYAVLEKIDRSVIEAARDLGAGSAEVFFKITIPLSFSGIVAGCIMVFLPALTLFYVSDILGGADISVLGTIIRNKFTVDKDWPIGAAISVSLTVFMLLLLKLYFKSGNTVEEERQLW